MMCVWKSFLWLTFLSFLIGCTSCPVMVLVGLGGSRTTLGWFQNHLGVVPEPPWGGSRTTLGWFQNHLGVDWGGFEAPSVGWIPENFNFFAIKARRGDASGR